ncbi:hypothetical protein LOTGIDRAFT_172560 [Lottia gigantea]|uniref:KASH domain-containing protein n=1 Tax=Lottia gigantea TaxID=225164 RepID=V4B228_LOTGI|nr:hypothetical protein LOTGIDRAFT_172560 [Lottia gigantea]ESP01616.1 hypothetical protein LOTGIDRAFT_172560 [Lottia gigantea]
MSVQKEIESRSKVVSAVLKLSGRLENEFVSDSETDDGESRQLVAVNLERRWHGIWLLSLEWQCRLEEVLNKKKSLYGSGLDFGNFRLPSLEESFASDNGKDLTNSSYGDFDDSFNFISCQRDVVGDTPSPTDIARLSLGKSSFLDKSSGDSANISEAESKMEESVQGGESNENISSEGEAELLQRTKNRVESKDVGYSSEGHSNDEAELLRLQMLEDRYQGLVQVASDSPLANETMKITDKTLNPEYYFMTTVDVDSTDKTTDNDDVYDFEKYSTINGFNDMKDGFEITPIKMAPTVNLKQTDSDSISLSPPPITLNGQDITNITSETSESDYCMEPTEKIKLLIDRAEDLVRSPKQFFHSTPDKQELNSSPVKLKVPKSPSKQTQTTQTLPIDSSSVVETSCDASGEETDNESSGEEFSTASDDSGDAMFDSVICSDYTSDSRAASQESVSFISPIKPVNFESVQLRSKTCRNGKERPWSFMDVQELKKQCSTSDGAINHPFTDSDSPTRRPNLNSLRQGSSTFPRQRTKSHHTRRLLSSTESSSLRAAKRKLHYPSSETTLCPESQTDQVVPCLIKTDDELTPINQKDDFGELFASAMLKASSANSSLSESDSETSEAYDTAPLEPLTSENEDVLNSTGSFSENAWDNYQAPLYPTASEDPAEEPLHWEPTDEMEFDDEFTIPSDSIINHVLAASQTNTLKKKSKPLPVPSQFDDSDSDIEDFHHIIDQSKLQLKKADQSLKKKRKDAMGTGIHLNPAKYVEILSTCETNKSCVESICQHMTTDSVTDSDVTKVQDLLYQWEKLHALATERLSQSRQLADFFKELEDMKLTQRNVQESLSHTSFNSIQELCDSIRALNDHQELLKDQEDHITTLLQCVTLFNETHESINTDKYITDISDIQQTNTELQKWVKRQVREQEEKLDVLKDYNDSRKELDYLLSQDRLKLQKLLVQHEIGIYNSPTHLLRDIEDIQSNLEVYESKLQCLSQLRSRLSCSSDDSAQRDYLASVADLRNQLFTISKRCRDARLDLEDEQYLRTDEADYVSSETDVHSASLQDIGKCNGLEADTTDDNVLNKRSGNRSWLSSYPLPLAALVMIAGLVYLMDPEVIDRITNFSVTLSPELRYVNGNPPT